MAHFDQQNLRALRESRTGVEAQYRIALGNAIERQVPTTSSHHHSRVAFLAAGLVIAATAVLLIFA